MRKTRITRWVNQNYGLFLSLATRVKCWQLALTLKATPGSIQALSLTPTPASVKGDYSQSDTISGLIYFNLLVLIQGPNLRTTSGLQEIMWQVAPGGSAGLWLNRKTDTGNKHVMENTASVYSV